MPRKKIRTKLTNEEYNLLNNLTRQTKTDCWFVLDVDKEGFDCVRDLERGNKITLRHAIRMLNDALIVELLKISIEDMYVYTNLLNKLNIDYNPFEEAIEIHKNVYAGKTNGI